MLRVFSITVCILLLSLAATPAMADVREELQGINKEIKEKKQLLKKTKKVESKVSGELELIDKNLHEKEANLTSLNQDLQGVEVALERTQQEIARVRDEAERKKQQIRCRLAALYKTGEMGNARMFFASASFPQMTENLRYMKAVLTNDRKLFAEFDEKIARLRTLRGRLESDVVRKEKIKANISAKKQEIEEEKQKKTVYLSQLKEDKKSYIASLKELQVNARRLQAMVERLEARNRKSYNQKAGVSSSITLPLIPDKGFGSQKGRLAFPVRGNIVDQFGRHKHPEFNSYTVSNGISIVSPLGTDIHAVYDGQVIYADYFKGYGNMIIVDHGGGYFSLYAHAAKINTKVGTTVTRNDILANVGDVDSSRGPMLYFEIRYQGKPINPAPWFR